jgi:hypothetical protein
LDKYTKFKYSKELTSGAGTNIAATVAGGYGTVLSGATEEYNGATWTSVNSMNTARYQLAGAGTTQTAGLAFAGRIPSDTGATEEYDGTSWTNTSSMATARDQLAGAGTQSSALGMGGDTTANTAATEEWTGPGAALTKTITVS